MKQGRTFWKYLWSGFPLAIVFLILGVLAFLSGLDEAPLAVVILSIAFVVALIAGIVDYRKNG